MKKALLRFGMPPQDIVIVSVDFEELPISIYVGLDGKNSLEMTDAGQFFL